MIAACTWLTLDHAMSDDSTTTRTAALTSFEKARNKAKLKQAGARLTRKNNQLISFDAVRTELRLKNPLYQGLQEIELEKIVGSIGRYREFTRDFLPLNDSLRERWVGVSKLAGSTGWPPIELYQVGDAYFVRDGNHRTAVARKEGLTTIEAHVWAFPAAAAIDTNKPLDDILIELGAQAFEAETRLGERYPDHGILFTTPGRYNELLAQIEAFRLKLQAIDAEPKSTQESVDMWYEMAYLPTMQIIHETELLQQFPGRSEADLYVWLSKHRDELGELYGPYDNLGDLAKRLADRYTQTLLGKVATRAKKLVGAKALSPLPEPDQTRSDLEAEKHRSQSESK